MLSWLIALPGAFVFRLGNALGRLHLPLDAGPTPAEIRCPPLTASPMYRVSPSLNFRPLRPNFGFECRHAPSKTRKFADARWVTGTPSIAGDSDA